MSGHVPVAVGRNVGIAAAPPPVPLATLLDVSSDPVDVVSFASELHATRRKSPQIEARWFTSYALADCEAALKKTNEQNILLLVLLGFLFFFDAWGNLTLDVSSPSHRDV